MARLQVDAHFSEPAYPQCRVIQQEVQNSWCMYTRKTSNKISIDTAGKRILKLANLRSLMVTRPKQAKLLLQKVLKFYRRLYGGGYELVLHHTNIYKILKLCSSNIFVSFRQITLKLSNFTLILRRSFQVSSLFITY